MATTPLTVESKIPSTLRGAPSPASLLQLPRPLELTATGRAPSLVFHGHHPHAFSFHVPLRLSCLARALFPARKLALWGMQTRGGGVDERAAQGLEIGAHNPSVEIGDGALEKHSFTSHFRLKAYHPAFSHVAKVRRH